MTNENMITMQEAKRRFRLAFPLYRDKREPMPEGVVYRQLGDDVEHVPLKWESGKRRMRRTSRERLPVRTTTFKEWVRAEYTSKALVLCPKLATILKAPLPESYAARKAAQDANRRERYRSNAANRGMKRAKREAAPPKLSKKELAAAAEATAHKKGR